MAKKILLIILIILTIILIYVTKKINTKSTPPFINEDGGLYAHAITNIDSKEVWLKWQSYTGANSQKDYKYFLIPQSADDNYVEIYNNYPEDVRIGNVKIRAKKSAIIEYKKGEEIDVSIDNETCKLLIYKSNAEASVFISDSSNLYKDYKGEEVSNDLYSFLIQDKKNYAQDVKCTIVNNNEVIDTTLKKIKGRGNSTWDNLENKPFNITFYEPTLIGHTKSKKFSVISNGSDSTMLRNRIMYDLCDEVGLPYSPTSSYIDFYVNGSYKGCYLACEKVDLGKNSLVSLKDNSDKVNSNFSFLVEVDCWNYYNDVYFVTDRGYHIVLKTPDLKDYDENDTDMKAKFEFIRNTYQNFENILYNGTLEELEKICDIESLAKMYLAQELGKNCDGGLTSTFFTYNADEGKFYATPIWDFDSAFGAFDIIKEGYTISTCNYKGWLTKYATYNGIINPLGQCFNISGKTSEGKIFEEICKDIWNEKFMPSINILLGNGEAKGKLKSIDEYQNSCEKAMYNNYIMWNFRWFCPSYESRLGKEYSKDYNGEVEYLKDWIVARSNWMNSMFNFGKVEETKKSYYLTGENLGGWGNMQENNKLISNGDGTYSITKVFKANEYYEFKVIDSEGKYYKGNYLDFTTLEYSKIEKQFFNACFTYENDTELTIILDGDYFKVLPTKGKDNTLKPISSGNREIYFKNTLGWENVYYRGYGDKYMFTDWPGLKAEFVGKSEDGFDIYMASVDLNIESIVFNNGGIEEETEEIKFVNSEEKSFYMPNKDGYTNYRTFKIYSVDKIENKVIK